MAYGDLPPPDPTAGAFAKPSYIAARFDLAIEFIYQGILLGTGPQVDPGFQGVLSCPLHNISDSDVNLRYGYPFAKIEPTVVSLPVHALASPLARRM